MPSVKIFIDGSNIFHGSRDFSRMIGKDIAVDYLKLRDVLLGDRDEAGTIFFSAHPTDIPERQQAFHHRLQNQGFELVLRPLKTGPGKDKPYEKGVDVALATRLLIEGIRGNMDVCILISGDANYVDAINELRMMGITVEIAAFRQSVGDELLAVADEFNALDDLLDNISM
jgi:uncharacterized LabA/DUF88 family protein